MSQGSVPEDVFPPEDVALPVAVKEQVRPSASFVVMVAVPAPWFVMVKR